MKKELSVIIVNYNTCALVKECLESIHHFSEHVSYEIIIVDNNSSDDSKEMLSQSPDGIKVILNDSNLGFGSANNQALRIATGVFVLFLNPDTRLTNNALRQFLDRPEWHDTSVGAMGAILQDNDGEYMHSYGFFPTFGRLVNTPPKDYKPSAGKGAYPVEYVTGAALMIRRSVLDDVGFFDEDYFLYYEEVDLQYRMHLRGYERLVVEGPGIIHYRGQSASDDALRSAQRRNGESLYFRKHHYFAYFFLKFKRFWSWHLRGLRF